MDTKARVEKLAKEILQKHRLEVAFLCKELSITEEDILSAWIVWDTGINEYGNEIYDSHAMRAAMHFHNYIPNNWHDKRQSIVLDLLNEVRPASIIEVGFGTPQRYVIDYVLRNRVQLSLLDFDHGSLEFAEAFLNSKSDDWSEFISLRKYDMNSQDDVGKSDCYILQDSIEHASDPTAYLGRIVGESPVGSHFIFSLPIEVDRAVPEHKIYWKDIEDVQSWLKTGGLTQVSCQEIEMDEDLDLFAKYLHPDFKEVVIHSIKH